MSHNRDLSAAAAQIGFHNSNIGIGTDVPSETITLNHANGASIGLEYAGSEHGTINVNSAAMYARAGSGKHLILGGNATEALRLKSDGKAYFTGNVGFDGQTSPGSSIHINNFGNSGYELKLTGNALQFNRTSSSYVDQINDSGSILFRMGSSYTEAMRITSDRRIGINETAPDRTLHVNSGATDTALKIESTDTEVSLELADNSGSSYIGGGGSHLNFYTGGNERARFDSSGNFGLGTNNPNDQTSAGYRSFTVNDSSGGIIDLRRGDIALSGGRLVGLQHEFGLEARSQNSSSQISFYVNNAYTGRWTVDGLCFGSDTAAANALDDYEEGNFTPIVRGRTTAGTASYGRTAVGKYTKVGRMVSVIVDMVFSSANGSGNIEIAGLPFAAHSGPYVRFAGDVTLLTSGLSWSNQIACYINDTNSHFWITNTPTSGNYSFVNINSNTTEILLHCTYMVS